MSRTITAQELEALSPLANLGQKNIDALVKKVEVRQITPGQVLFREGDTEKQSVYVLDGTVQLHRDREARVHIDGGSVDARKPLSPLLPRHSTAIAVTPVEYIAIDCDLLDVMLTWDQTGAYEAPDIDSDDTAPEDWVAALLTTRVFHKVPPANIQQVFARLQEVYYQAGDVVIQQDEGGDYFYVITRGRCTVIRETPHQGDGIRLAELGVGDTFGEEALISDTKRNATVVMKSAGSLMRLGKRDFQTLLNEPMLSWVNDSEADEIVQSGGQWLDVRLPSEFEAYHHPGAINMPLYFIRLKLNTLDTTTHYVVCCDTGRRSSAGAFILNERGFDACVLTGGLNHS